MLSSKVPIPAASPTLDRTSAPHPWLDALLSVALDDLHLLANGATASLVPKINSGSGFDTKAPVEYDGDAPYFLRRYLRCRTHRDRLYVIKEAQVRRDSMKYASARTDRSLIRDTIEWKHRIANDERPVRAICTIYGVAPNSVVKWRREYRVIVPTDTGRVIAESGSR